MTPLSEWLVALTEQVCKVTGCETGYGLGGRFGYGENYENDVFSMHRFCWCEGEDCPWCRACACGDDYAENPCKNCKERPARAPNFLHKASGASITWYKYIGRGMEVDQANWPVIMQECFASLAVQNETPLAGDSAVSGQEMGGEIDSADHALSRYFGGFP